VPGRDLHAVAVRRARPAGAAQAGARRHTWEAVPCDVRMGHGTAEPRCPVRAGHANHMKWDDLAHVSCAGRAGPAASRAPERERRLHPVP
jgi:hypothetical protein